MDGESGVHIGTDNQIVTKRKYAKHIKANLKQINWP